VRTALDNWKASTDLVKGIAKGTGQRAIFYLLDDFLIHLNELMDIITQKKVNNKSLNRALQREKSLREILNKYREEITRDENKD